MLTDLQQMTPAYLKLLMSHFSEYTTVYFFLFHTTSSYCFSSLKYIILL